MEPFEKIICPVLKKSKIYPYEVDQEEVEFILKKDELRTIENTKVLSVMMSDKLHQFADRN